MVREKAFLCDTRNSIIISHKTVSLGILLQKKCNHSARNSKKYYFSIQRSGNVQVKPKLVRPLNITKRDKRALRALIKQNRRAPSRELAAK